MTLLKTTLDQLTDEPTPDYIKFMVFAGMGSARSLSKAYKQFYETSNEVSESWRKLAEKYHWSERATDYDKRVEKA